MEKPYAELSDQELAKALAGNHAAIQNYWTQVSGLAAGRGRAIDELIASHVKNVERLERENEDLREEWSRRLDQRNAVLPQDSDQGRATMAKD